jgi:hypothetical protein
MTSVENQPALETVSRSVKGNHPILRDAVLVTMAVAVLVTVVLVDQPRDPPAGLVREESRSDAPRTWTELPLPPERRDGSSLVWAGMHLVLWGGCDSDVKGECRATRDGFVFDLLHGRWRPLSPAPEPGVYARAVWTGREVVFVAQPQEGGRLVAQSYEPATDTWTSLPRPALHSATALVWTGTHVFAWSEGSRARPRVWKGVALGRASDAWEPVAPAPLALNLTSAMWTGTEVILFGSLLDGRNWPETKRSVGVAYSPATDSWRRLAPSQLSPQATSAALVAGKMVAWDYEPAYQIYDPVLDEWTSPRPMPFEFNECYPSSEVMRVTLFAFFCGEAATFDPVRAEWDEVTGGPLKDRINASGDVQRVWRFASMASSGEAIYMLLQGITATKRGVACFGCRGSPESFWVYRPPVGL